MYTPIAYLANYGCDANELNAIRAKAKLEYQLCSLKYTYKRIYLSNTKKDVAVLKHTLLQALMGKTVNTKVDPIVRNIPIPTNLGTLQIPDVTHTGI